MLQAGAATLASAGLPGRRHTSAQEGTPLPKKEVPMSDDVLVALQTSRAWINYSPARPFDFVVGQHQ